MFHGNTMFIGNGQVFGQNLLRFIAVASGGYKTDLNFNNIIATLCLLAISSLKNSPANAIKISAVILNLASDKPDSDKNRKR